MNSRNGTATLAGATLILFAAFGVAGVLGPRSVSASTAAALDQVLGTCPGQCSDFDCESGQHTYDTEETYDESYGSFHPFPDCQDKSCCWLDGKNGLHPPCGQPCFNGLTNGAQFEVLEKAVQESDQDMLFGILDESRYVVLNTDRSSIQLKMPCGDRVVANLPVAAELTTALQQRLERSARR